jgi:hypothetical protein
LIQARIAGSASRTAEELKNLKVLGRSDTSDLPAHARTVSAGPESRFKRRNVAGTQDPIPSNTLA